MKPNVKFKVTKTVKSTDPKLGYTLYDSDYISGLQGFFTTIKQKAEFMAQGRNGISEALLKDARWKLSVSRASFFSGGTYVNKTQLLDEGYGITIQQERHQVTNGWKTVENREYQITFIEPSLEAEEFILYLKSKGNS